MSESIAVIGKKNSDKIEIDSENYESKGVISQSSP